MSKYLNYIGTYATTQDYNSDTKKDYPNISFVQGTDEVKWTSRNSTSVMLTFEAVSAGTLTITASDASVAKTISYSTDNGATWTSLTTSTTAQQLGGTLGVGDKILVKGTNTAYGTSSNYNSFGGTANIRVYGNIMSLIGGDNFENLTTLSTSHTFYRLFNYATNLVDAKNLILPATTLSNSCYENMFIGCTSLTTAPTTLPATTLTESCYYSMFYGCTGLTTAPALPATTLASYCYTHMFNGCSSLTTAPVLPATTLASYCYNGIFKNCSSLNYIKAMFTTQPDNTNLTNWVENVAASGTFVKNANATWNVTGNNGVPSGWTIETASE